jgi:phage I-like protein
MQLHGRICLHSISGRSIALPEDGSAPEWIELLPLGTFMAVDGRGPFRADGEEIIAATRENGLDRGLPIDYDHATYLRDDSRAAGWIHALKIVGGKLLARVEWTPKGASAIAAREYRFVSPVFEFDPDDPKAPPEKASGRITYLTGAGLVNDPALKMTPLAA